MHIRNRSFSQKDIELPTLVLDFLFDSARLVAEKAIQGYRRPTIRILNIPFRVKCSVLYIRTPICSGKSPLR